MMMPKATPHAGIGRMSALEANRTRRDIGNDVNDPEPVIFTPETSCPGARGTAGARRG